MKAVLSSELERFRVDVAAWIASNKVDALLELARPAHRAAVYNLSYGAWTGPPGRLSEAWQQWQERNYAAGYMCPHWPVEVGGRGWDALRMVVWNEELAAAGMPRANRGLGEHLVGPAIIVHGTPDQKTHFLPRVISGQDTYAQGFSEPEAGSDLASLRTRGRVDGDEIVVDGQKIWTSFGHLGNKIFLLCRTDPTVSKNRGITYVIMDLHDNGIEMRPTRQMTGEFDFTEEFIAGARAPLFNVIGGIDNGWRVAMTVLGYERGQMATVQHLAIESKFWQTVDEARANGQIREPAIRRRLAIVYSRIQALRMSGLRILAGTAFDKDIDRISSAGKIYLSELDQTLARIGFDVRGLDALIRPSGEASYVVDQWQHELLHSRCLTIQGGTNEVQRNILGERVLGLPREPRPTVAS